jgi:hypothetical protein
VVFGSLEEAALVDWYVRAGAEQRLVRGWKVAADLLPFVISGVTFEQLKEQVDGFADEG